MPMSSTMISRVRDLRRIMCRRSSAGRGAPGKAVRWGNSPVTATPGRCGGPPRTARSARTARPGGAWRGGSGGRPGGRGRGRPPTPAPGRGGGGPRVARGADQRVGGAGAAAADDEAGRVQGGGEVGDADPEPLPDVLEQLDAHG